MSTAGHTPNFVAESSIYPFRCVKVGTAPFKAVPSTANPEILLGVTDGSIQTFNGTYHATAGQTISLQNGEFVQLTASGSITVGDTLIATTDGKVAASVSATEYIAQAAENASDGEIFWAKKVGAWTVSGGGPSPIGSGWPAPESKALWQCEFTGAVPNFTNTPTTAAFAPGPDYYFQTLNSASGVVEQNALNVNGHFGVVDATNAEFTNAANWIIVGNAPTQNWRSSAYGGKPGAALAQDNHEFVTIWRPFSTFIFDMPNVWQVFAGCWRADGPYPLDNSGGANTSPCFLFVASNASPNWICRARFIGARPANLPVDYDYDTGIAHANVWYNMKIVSVPGSGAAPYPTIEYYLNGTLVHSFNVNTGVSAPASPSQSVDFPYFTVAGNSMNAGPGVTRWITSQIDYQHSLTNFTTSR